MQLERSMVEGEARYDELEDMVAGYEPVEEVGVGGDGPLG
jgi:hypothetical protein